MNELIKEIEDYKSKERLVVVPNTKKKNHITLCYPDVYPIGMPNLGVQHLFRIINSRKEFFAGRCYMPGKHLWKYALKDRKLYNWDSIEEVRSSKIVTFTISFEDQYLNIIRMLEFAGINPIAKLRSENDPIILGAGPCSSYNPETLAYFFDAFLIGEGEEVIEDILDLYLASKTKSDFLDRLDSIECIYRPDKYRFYFEGSRIKRIETMNSKTQIYRRYVKDININPVRSSVITPLSVYGEEVFSIEVSRGCEMHCRFCYMGNHLRKQRRLKIAKVRELIDEGIKFTKNIKLFYEALPPEYMSELYDLLLEFIENQGICLKVGSFRIENLRSNIINIVLKGKQTSIVLAPETCDGDARKRINKGDIRDEDIISVINECVLKGVNHVGLYFMLGLPGESLTDLDNIARLITNVSSTINSKIDNGLLEIHINSFFPKPLTPFQWEENITQDEARKRLSYLQGRINMAVPRAHICKIVYKTGIEGDITFSQPILARGDRRLCQVLLTLAHNLYPYNKSEISNALWEKVLRSYSIDPRWYYQKKKVGEILPWSIIKNSIDETYYKDEICRAYKLKTTPKCPEVECDACKRCVGRDKV